MKYNLQQHPFFFGAFANMARNNVQNILSYIADRVEGTTKPDSEEKLYDTNVIAWLSPNHKPSVRFKGNPTMVRVQIIQQLEKHFVFLKALSISTHASNPNPSDYYDIIYAFLKHLDAVRNQYTHAYHSQTPFSIELIQKMNFIFDDGLRVIKDRYGIKDNICHLQRYHGVANGKPKPNPDFKYKFSTYNGDVTEKGIAFFICLFLEKEYACLFLKKLSGFKKGDDAASRATLEVYSVYRCSLPLVKISSTGFSKEALLLDMLNELLRCPAQLYDTLSQNDKQPFITNILSSIEDYEEIGDENQTIMQRKKNRFPYFALRYIDSMHLFHNLRFHVDLGNFHFMSYDKQMDDMLILRRWEKKLLSFGRLQDCIEKPECWQKHSFNPAEIKSDTPAPFLVHTYPHYHFVGNNIGLRNIKVPKAQKGTTSLQQHSLWPPIKPDSNQPQTSEPDFYLATDELPGLLFYHQLSNLYPNTPTAETIILDYGKNVNKFFQSILDGTTKPLTNSIGSKNNEKISKEEYLQRVRVLEKNTLQAFKLNSRQLPDRVVKYLLGISPHSFTTKAEATINILLAQTREKLAQLKPSKSKKIERNKSRNDLNRSGHNALFLAEDMLYFQPPIINNVNNQPITTSKANPDAFKILQSRLALYGREKENLHRTFEFCKLINSPNPHPFLHKVNMDNCNTSLEFYNAYLQQRKQFLENILKKRNFNDYYFLHKFTISQEQSDFLKYTQDIKNKPTNLPRGLFKDAIINLIIKNDSSELKNFIQTPGSTHNTVSIINKYYEINGDSFQPFYNHLRNYRTVNEWFDNRKSQKEKMKPIANKPLSVDDLTKLAVDIKNSKRYRDNKDTNDQQVPFYKVFSEKVIENEKLIRHIRTSDQVLFLLCKDLLINLEDKVAGISKSKFLLSNITNTDKKSILETKIDFSIPIKLEKVEKETFKSITNKFKIKDYGKLRKYLKDRRIAALLSYFSTHTIPLSEVKKQLKDYESCRMKIFDIVYKFEAACNSDRRFSEFIKQKVSTDGTINHRDLLLLFTQTFTCNKDEIDQLKEIRNSFSHNVFPDFGIIKPILTSDKSYVTQIADYAIRSYQKYISLIEENK